MFQVRTFSSKYTVRRENLCILRVFYVYLDEPVCKGSIYLYSSSIYRNPLLLLLIVYPLTLLLCHSSTTHILCKINTTY